MLSYRHAYHAGNFADVLKHTVLLHCLNYLQRKDKPLRLIDTHAGAGMYALNAESAQKTREYQNGIGKIWPLAELPNALQPYIDYVKRLNENGSLQYYPGSPAIFRDHMRPQDQLFLHELHSTDARILGDVMGHDKQVKIIEDNGLAGMQALLPPPDRRGLVLIDPSYEIKKDYQDVVKEVIKAHRRFATGTIIIWYPVVLRERNDEMERALIKSGIKNIQLMEFGIAPDNPEYGMNSSGLIVINPPFTLWEAMEETLPFLVEHLGDTQEGFYRLEQLVAE